ncbi:MAG: hypothetical protein ABT940_00225 [Alphaproteobacteria bacterium]
MSGIRGASLLPLAGFLVVACTTPPPRWTRVDTTVGEARHDLASCRRNADQAVTRPRGADPDLDRDTGPAGGDSNPLRLYDIDRSERAFLRAVDDCMRSLGYSELLTKRR